MMTSGSTVIHNARLVTRNGSDELGWVSIENGTIADLGAGHIPSHASAASVVTRIDADGQWLAPGFVDMHVHGGDGAQVMDGTRDAILAIGRFHARHGTTGWLPTTLTASTADIVRALAAVQRVRCEDDDRADGARVLGVHLEGPFISPDKVGAQNPAFVVSPAIAIMDKFTTPYPGLIRKVTLAPERDGARDIIRHLTAQGIIPSIGHTDGSFDETAHAIQAGATHATHMFNAMRGLHHRDGGTVGACLASAEVVCELIADGHHVHPEVLKLMVRWKGPERIALITDAISATGQPDGPFTLGNLDIVVKQGIPYLLDSHTLAGSTLTMDVAVRNMVNRVGVTLSDAIQMASTTPAREIGAATHKGRLELGYDADLVLLDESLNISRTFVGGREVFCR